MTIKFLTDQAFKTGYNILFSHNFIFDLYRAEQTFKFFTDEMINNAKIMLASRQLTESEDYLILPYDWLV
jgi:hypothetical protein